ncbi:MAG: ATP-binding protein [Timaviella obliquedivisa GSE-PSE-MK23-08B]|jgi:energy-coupling factor transporter ATP-binding protein EcfA2|nr:ATP-binding protein [Timaviella obliquedivisa GSE-PSE-MK23-08B]
MTAFPTNRATTLKAAYRICTPEPLDGEGLDLYYVDLAEVRRSEAIAGVSTILDFQDAGEHNTILFTGHRGCGKSTELKRLQRQWEKTFHVIYLEANEETDINDARYVDLYLIVIKQVEYELRKLGLGFDAGLLKGFEDWFKEVTDETEKTVESSVSMTGEVTLSSGGIIPPFIAKLLVKLMAQIKGSDKRKTTIRQTLEQDISRLKADINLLLDDGLHKLRRKLPNCKDFLIIFDNLDRVPKGVSDHLFFDYAAQLQELHCTLIYTVPLAALYSPRNMSNTFGSPNIVPMVNIYQFERDRCDLAYNEPVLAKMASVIEQRVDVEAVFAERESLLGLARSSGGHVRQLMQIMQTSCLTASTRGHAKIEKDDVLYAVNKAQFEFERLIPAEHYPLLAQTCVTKNVSKDETGQLMLFNTSVLEYNGTNRWNDVNPLVKKIDAFQQSLEAFQAFQAL